jgi:hypothetical protein
MRTRKPWRKKKRKKRKKRKRWKRTMTGKAEAAPDSDHQRTAVTWGAVVIVVILGVGCSGDKVGSSVASHAAPSATTMATTASISDEDRIQAALDRAVDSLLDAGSYSFAVEVVLAVGATTVESELEGWVDGSDRELQLRVGDSAVVTRVLDGVATVERDGVVSEVPLERAEKPPSLEILRTLDQALFLSPTEISGFLVASVLESTGVDNEGIATVVLYLTQSGTLAGYEMQSSDTTWTVSARFSDVGSNFTS